MPRSKKTPEQLEEKAHADMINNMMTLYKQASNNNRKQYMRLKVAHGFLVEMLKILDKKYNDRTK